MPRPQCKACGRVSSTPRNFLLVCECGSAWHHRCTSPPVEQDALMGMISAFNKGKGMGPWRCKACVESGRTGTRVEEVSVRRDAPGPRLGRLGSLGWPPEFAVRRKQTLAQEAAVWPPVRRRKQVHAQEPAPLFRAPALSPPGQMARRTRHISPARDPPQNGGASSPFPFFPPSPRDLSPAHRARSPPASTRAASPPPCRQVSPPRPVHSPPPRPTRIVPTPPLIDLRQALRRKRSTRTMREEGDAPPAKQRRTEELRGGDGARVVEVPRESTSVHPAPRERDSPPTAHREASASPKVTPELPQDTTSPVAQASSTPPDPISHIVSPSSLDSVRLEPQTLTEPEPELDVPQIRQSARDTELVPPPVTKRRTPEVEVGPRVKRRRMEEVDGGRSDGANALEMAGAYQEAKFETTSEEGRDPAPRNAINELEVSAEPEAQPLRAAEPIALDEVAPQLHITPPYPEDLKDPDPNLQQEIIQSNTEPETKSPPTPVRRTEERSPEPALLEPDALTDLEPSRVLQVAKLLPTPSWSSEPAPESEPEPKPERATESLEPHMGDAPRTQSRPPEASLPTPRASSPPPELTSAPPAPKVRAPVLARWFTKVEVEQPPRTTGRRGRAKGAARMRTEGAEWCFVAR